MSRLSHYLSMVCLLTAFSFAIQGQIVTPVITAATTNETELCGVTTSGAGFLTTDPQAWFNFSYTGGVGSNAFTIEWVDPNGAVYSTSQLPLNGNSCLSSSVPIAGYAAALLTGSWSVKLLWNTALLASVPFTIETPSVPITVSNNFVTVAVALTCTLGNPCTVDSSSVTPSTISITPTSYTFTSATFYDGAATTNWLSLSAQPNGVLQISVSPLEVYSGGVGFITITSANMSNGPQIILVQATVSCTGNGCAALKKQGSDVAPPTIEPPLLSLTSASPTSISLGVSADDPHGYTITGVNLAATYEVSPNGSQSWLTVPSTCPATGICPINLNLAGLAPGQYLATLAFSDIAGGCPSGCFPQITTVPVQLIVTRAATPPQLQFIPATPCRILDTRNTTGPFGGPYLSGGTARSIPIPSSTCGIPPDASAYSLNFTVVPRAGTLGYLTVWPTGQTQPLVSTLNSEDGSIIANAAIVPAGTAGSINAFASNDTDLIVDVNGYFAPPSSSSLQFYPLTPCRIVDTRGLNGPYGGPSIPANSSRSIAISSSSCGVPANASAYALNLTAVPHGALSYLTAWPAGQAQPLVSSLNSPNGITLANAAIVPAGTGGNVNFYASNTTDLVIDINGYFAAPGTGGLNFYTATPCRVADTRNQTGPLGGPGFGAGTTRAFPLSQSSCSLPGSLQALSLNMTVVPQGPLGYLTTWPTGGTEPLVSTLNAVAGQIVANAAIVAPGVGESINVFASNPTHLVIDVNGYFAP